MNSHSSSPLLASPASAPRLARGSPSDPRYQDLADEDALLSSGSESGDRKGSNVGLLSYYKPLLPPHDALTLCEVAGELAHATLKPSPSSHQPHQSPSKRSSSSAAGSSLPSPSAAAAEADLDSDPSLASGSFLPFKWLPSCAASVDDFKQALEAKFGKLALQQVGSLEVLPTSYTKDSKAVFASPFLKSHTASLHSFLRCWMERGFAYAVEETVQIAAENASTQAQSSSATSPSASSPAAAAQAKRNSMLGRSGSDPALLAKKFHELSKLSQYALYFARACRFLSPSQQPLSTSELAHLYCHPNWLNGPLRAMAWHAHLPRLSIADASDVVYVFDKHYPSPLANTISAGRWLQRGLKNHDQQDITCLAWRPLSGVNLAVGCRKGVVLWNIPSLKSTTTSGRDSASANRAATAVLLTYPGHLSVVSIAWNPDGRLLASGSAVDTAFVIWDIFMDTATPIRRYSGSAGISCLSWSPNGEWLLTASSGGSLRIWETQTWSSEKWSVRGSGRVSSACWSSDSSTVLFAITGDSMIYSISLSQQVSSWFDDCVSVEDFSPEWLYSEHEDDNPRLIGGAIESFHWDHNSERLVVCFARDESQEEGSNNVALVLRTRTRPSLQLVPIGFIQGPPDSAGPQYGAFFHGYTDGSLLAMNWVFSDSDQKSAITILPFNYIPENLLASGFAGTEKVKTLSW